MLLQQQVAAELTRQAKFLPEEINEFGALAEQNINGMGIHRSQLRAINLTVEELQGKHTPLLSGLKPELPADEFAEQRRKLEAELSGSQGIISIFRHIFVQRRDAPRYLSALDAADLIAGNCYNYALELAKSWGAISADEVRAPPLTYLNAKVSPFALTRRSTFSKFKLPLDNYLEWKVPIPVVAMPFHYATATWLLCSLFHEVGHLLDQDLGLRGQLREPLRKAVAEQNATDTHVQVWGYWLGELIADVFGVLLGGGAFAYRMLDILFAPKGTVTALDTQDIEHPNHCVRLYFIAAVLRGTNVPDLALAADDVEQRWVQIYGPPEQLNGEFPAYIAEGRAAAAALLSTTLPGLKEHRLLDFAPQLQEDQKQIKALAKYLRKNFMRPDPGPPAFPYRFVPAAAQLAVQGVTADHEANYDGIQQRALSFIKAIPRPEFLAPTGMSPGREAFLRQLVRDLSFE